MFITIILFGLFIAPPQDRAGATAEEKRTFLELLSMLPTAAEFFTDEAIIKAAPHTRVLLALTEKDIEGLDMYPFLALSRGLVDRKEPRDFGVKYFSKIAHPEIKLAWAVMLFDLKSASPEIVRFLREVLDSKEQSKILAKMIGSKFEDFKRRLKEHPSGER